jgi:hypothetical protein
MNMIEWETEDGVLEEADLWKLFSDHPDKSSETIQFYYDLKPLLAKMRLEDETRYYHVYRHSAGFPDSPGGARFRATVTQRNLRRVATAISGRGKADAAIQYLGPNPQD